MYPIDLTGKQFGKWTVLKLTGRKRSQSLWECRCECGNVKTKVLYTHLTQGGSRSCGCFRKELLRFKGPPHLKGDQSNYLYSTWMSIKTRCFNTSHKTYQRYGARGITLHPSWVHDFHAFANYIGPRPHKNWTVERMDNNGNYEPGNVKWATRATQNRNRRNNRIFEWKGRTMIFSDICEMENVDKACMYQRVFYKGVPLGQAVAECQAKNLTFENSRKSKPEIIFRTSETHPSQAPMAVITAKPKLPRKKRDPSTFRGFNLPPHLKGSHSNPLYSIWLSIKTRCFNPNHPTYRTHGAKGITLHPDWVNNFQAFASHVGPRPHPRATLKRPDPAGHYAPGNIQWAYPPGLCVQRQQVTKKTSTSSEDEWI